VEDHPPILRNSPLQIVAVELRFPETVLLPEDLKEVRRALAQEYPKSDTERGVGIELSPEGAVRQQSATQRQVYRTVDGSHQVGLTTISLVLEARGPQYEGFRGLLDRWMLALDAVAPVAEITLQSRLGLRYVNQLPVEDASVGLSALDGRINPVLLAPIGDENFPLHVVTSIQELRLRGDHGSAALRHGLQVVPPQVVSAGASAPGQFAPGQGILQGEQPSAGVYILDIDYYDEQPTPFEREGHVEQLKRFNEGIWEIFRWSLTDTGYEAMQPEDRE
jgi:uncharacterized protein (TIGR04255 family)